jgi:L-Ala-D/L-Glu epimerase
MASESSLSIIRIEVYPVQFRLKAPFKIATMTAPDAPNVLVKVSAKGGLEGWGEASFMQSINGESQETVVAAIKTLGPHLLGREPRQVRWLSDFMGRLLPGQSAARCALDTALWDLAAQAAGEPLWRFLGGTKRLLETDMTIGAVSVEEAESSAAHWAGQGFRVLKLKIGTGVEDDSARFEAVKRGAAGRARVRLDANQGYSRMEAHRAFVSSVFEGAEFCEQPLARHDLEGMKWLSGFSTVPVMADESLFTPEDAGRLGALACCPLGNIKISKSGGITGGSVASDILAAHGMGAMMGGMMESRIGVTASAHLGSAREVFHHFDLDANKDHLDDPVIGGTTIQEGLVNLPETPGLGAKVDEDFLTAFPRIVVE